jgi:hypothetical protein
MSTNSGHIAGGAVGGLIFIVIVICVIIYLRTGVNLLGILTVCCGGSAAGGSGGGGQGMGQAGVQQPMQAPMDQPAMNMDWTPINDAAQDPIQ